MKGDPKMARPASGADKKLIRVGLRLIAQNGTKALSIRKICQTANVNLGMFSYYFKNKENYLRILFNDIFNNLFKFLNMEQTTGMNELERLKYFSFKMLDFAFQNKNLFRAVFIESAIEQNVYERYVKQGILKPFDLPFQLVEAAQKAGFLRTDMNELEIQRLFFFSTAMPILFSECLALLRIDHPIPPYTKADAQKRLEILFNEVEKKK